MLNDQFIVWEQAYRNARKQDKRDVLFDHMDRLGYEVNSESLFGGTIQLVLMAAVYLSMDNRSVDKFLSAQAYNPQPTPETPYIFTFDLCGKAFGRVFVGTGENKMIDLADLFNCSWQEYKVAGYYEFIISRADLKPLLVKEIKSLTKMVKDDLYYDFSKAELDIYFNEYGNRSFLKVAVTEKS